MIDDIPEVSNSDFGNKILGIKILNSIGVSTPKSACLGFSFYSDLMTESILKDIYLVLISNKDLNLKSINVKKIILDSVELNDQKIISFLNSNFPNDCYFAVRSSGAPFIKGKKFLRILLKNLWQVNLNLFLWLKKKMFQLQLSTVMHPCLILDQSHYARTRMILKII